MLEILTKEYDAQFGLGEQMFKDLVQSDDIMSQFRVWTSAMEYHDNLQVRVLQRGAWPFMVAKQQIGLTDEVGVFNGYVFLYRSAVQLIPI